MIDRDFENELGTRVRRPDTLRRWMAAYAASTATTTSLEKIREAAASGDSVPAKTTGLAYRDALIRLFILDPVDGWLPGGHPPEATEAGAKASSCRSRPGG